MSHIEPKIESVEVWTAAKIIGRECSTVSKEYFMCKKLHGEKHPTPCLKYAEVAHACGTDVVKTASTKFPTEYKALAKCLDYNDYRFSECKKEQKALYDCWNQFKGYDRDFDML